MAALDHMVRLTPQRIQPIAILGLLIGALISWLEEVLLGWW
jgi:hypothetical protein